MTKKRSVRLDDVAAAAGVHTSTVSRVLNNEADHRVSTETRERVLIAAKELNYHANAMARGLRTSRTHTLGIAVPQLDNPVFAQIIIGATAAAHSRGYDLLVSLVEDVSGESGVYERLAHNNRVDGLMVSTLEKDEVLVETLKRASVPYVIVNRKIRGVANCVAYDSFAAAKESTEYLLSLGHRRIGHLAGRLTGYNGTKRLAGYYAALNAAGIESDPQMVAEAGYTLEGGVRAVRSLLACKPRPTALLAATVLSAAGALKALYAAGIIVPDDMSVMSIHDVQIAEMLHPPLTTMRLPLQEMGRVATLGLVDLIEGKATVVSKLMRPEGLLIRASTAPPNNL